MISQHLELNQSASRRRTDNLRTGRLRANSQQLDRCWADSKRQRQAGSRIGHVICVATPDGLDRHTVFGGIQQIGHAGFRVMPQRYSENIKWVYLTQNFRIPMGQCRRASHCSISVISHEKFDFFCPGSASNYVRIRDVNMLFRRRESDGEWAEKANKSCPEATIIT